MLKRLNNIDPAGSNIGQLQPAGGQDNMGQLGPAEQWGREDQGGDRVGNMWAEEGRVVDVLQEGHPNEDNREQDDEDTKYNDEDGDDNQDQFNDPGKRKKWFICDAKRSCKFYISI